MKNIDNIIKEIKEYFYLHDSTIIKHVFPDDFLEKSNDIKCLKYLEKENYIFIITKCLGYYEFELTSYFIDNIECL